MRSIRIQYLITYALMGAVGPFLTVFFAERGLTRPQIGWIVAASSAGVILSPIFVTLLADTRLAGRRLVGTIFLTSGVTLALLAQSRLFWPLLMLHTLHALAFAPLAPLQDGLYFEEQHRRQATGRRVLPYHAVRVWGTVGFIIPSIVLYFVLDRMTTMTPAILAGVVVCGLGLLNSFFLPGTHHAADEAERHAGTAAAARPGGNGPAAAVTPPAPHRVNSRWPTIEAARAMLNPHVLVFCIGMMLLGIASSAYFPFFPIYVTEELGIDKKWVGLIFNIGVAVEIFFVLGFGWLANRFGVRWVMTVGTVCVAARMLLLALFPSVPMVLAVQVFHGMSALVTVIVPPVFLNQHARPGYRNSMQGLYTVAVMGMSRIIGSLLGGYVAGYSLLLLFGIAGALGLIAALLFQIAFRPDAATRAEPAAAARAGAPAVAD